MKCYAGSRSLVRYLTIFTQKKKYQNILLLILPNVLSTYTKINDDNNDKNV